MDLERTFTDGKEKTVEFRRTALDADVVAGTVTAAVVDLAAKTAAASDKANIAASSAKAVATDAAR
jgi:hypothetical protein